MPGTLSHDAPPMPNLQNQAAPLPTPNQGQQNPFPPGTSQQILQWINKLNRVIVDLQLAQKAGMNVASYMMRAQAAYQALQNIYTTYFGQIPGGG